MKKKWQPAQWVQYSDYCGLRLMMHPTTPMHVVLDCLRSIGDIQIANIQPIAPEAEAMGYRATHVDLLVTTQSFHAHDLLPMPRTLALIQGQMEVAGNMMQQLLAQPRPHVTGLSEIERLLVLLVHHNSGGVRLLPGGGRSWRTLHLSLIHI